ncbi:hypothetical protein CH293_23035 [Rhodococcus sp. 14-2470-1b]|jgi:hypothetical protein|uniref:hypothetical protein n=1 Tax=Rhodococcus sp. 14-2470-1b TaxID=2023149 RepID=UPI000B9B4B03|nr:hypothetical protein [Rhodococcus sp. 14-2470-1b]OZF44392.1 hypothetical protein CH293_23035 [Rhodococcus sp. 14-2470-1b]
MTVHLSSAEDVVYLADHSVVLALPALIPAFIIVAVVLYIVAKDRRAEKNENAESESADVPGRAMDDLPGDHDDGKKK